MGTIARRNARAAMPSGPSLGEMPMSRFEIAFSGQLVAGARPEVVKANLAKLFQADAQRIELLFSGRRVVIKNNLDAASAEKYRSVLERAGAIAVVAEMEIEEVVMAPPRRRLPWRPADPRRYWYQRARRTLAGSAAGRLHGGVRRGRCAGFRPGSGRRRPTGRQGRSRGAEARPEPLQRRPVGSDMGQARSEPAAPAPDTSHLRLRTGAGSGLRQARAWGG